jgi:hypothetical protein
MIKLNSLFDVIYGINLDLNKLKKIEKGIPYVGRSKKNNGVTAYVEKNDKIPNPAHTISVSGGGSVLECFYQANNYYSGRDLFYLKPKSKLSENQMLAYCYIIKKNKFRYNYGRQANKTLHNLVIPGPDSLPDWIENKSIEKKFSFNIKPFINKDIKLDKKLKTFYLGGDNGIFEITGSKTTPKKTLVKYGEGKFPYITTQTENNGVEAFFNFYTETGNVICVDSAVIGFCSYQEENFSASDHVEILKPKKFKLNKYLGIYFSSMLNKDNFRYNYGRKRSQSRLASSTIDLPVDVNNNIDLEWIESFIKSINYSNNI